MAWYAAGVTVIAIMTINGPMAALFLSGAACSAVARAQMAGPPHCCALPRRHAGCTLATIAIPAC